MLIPRRGYSCLDIVGWMMRMMLLAVIRLNDDSARCEAKNMAHVLGEATDIEIALAIDTFPRQ